MPQSIHIPPIVGPAANPKPARLPRVPLVIPERVARRAATHYVLDEETGCHVSTYSVASHGYAQIGWQEPGWERSRMTLCHRAAWVYANGTQIPDGMTIDHVCHNRRCVNPNHLRLLTNFENARRTNRYEDWPIGQCRHGHPNSDLRLRGSKVVCATCMRAWVKRAGEQSA